MSTTFMTSPRLFFTSESVTEGHPDKICDPISDGVLDACLEEDPLSRVACETATKTGFVMLLGEITTKAQVNFDVLARKIITDIGFDDSSKGFDGNTCGVLVAIGRQSLNIAQGVNHSMEVRGQGTREDEIDAVGAGDQGMMFGFACDETPTFMPMPIDLAHRLTRRLAPARRSGELPWRRPDGKAQGTVEYRHGRPARADTVLGQARRRRRPALPGRDPGGLRHRRCPSAFDQRRDLRHRPVSRRPDLQTRAGILRPAPGRNHPRPRPPAADLPPDRQLWSLWARRPRPSLGTPHPAGGAQGGNRLIDASQTEIARRRSPGLRALPVTRGS